MAQKGEGRGKEKVKTTASIIMHCVIFDFPLFFFRADTEDMLRTARRQQVDQKEHFLAVQAQRDRTEFERVLK